MSLADNFMWFPPKHPSDPPEIEGETRDEFFRQKRAFEVLSFRFSVSLSDRSATSSGDGGGGANAVVAPVAFDTFTITKVMDAASPMLYQVMCQHAPSQQSPDPTRIPAAMMAMRKPGGEFLLYLQFYFKELVITDLEWEGGGGDTPPTETVTFAFNAMGVQYRKQASKGGIAGRTSWGWDIPGNKALTGAGYL